MKKVLRKSDLVAGVLILVVVCLGIVFAGDVIIKEGDMDVGDVNSAGDGKFTGNLTVGTSSSQNHLYLESNGLPIGSIRGGSIAWEPCSGNFSYTYINAGNRFVWDASAQATEFDTGVGWVDFDDGDAHFEGDLSVIGDISGADLTSTSGVLKIKDPATPFYRTITTPAESISADRTFTLSLGNADRTLTMTGNAALNQDVKTTSSPTFNTVTAKLISTDIKLDLGTLTKLHNSSPAD